VRLWDLAKFKETTTLLGHEDRVLSGAISPDSRWAVSGGRDLQVKLWDLKERAEHASVQMESEVRFCAFLLDGQTLIAGDVSGKLALFAVPDLTELAAVQMPQPILCGALAPSGAQVALGCGDGRVHLIEVEGFDSAPLLVAVTQSTRLTATALQRLFGRKREVATFLGTCPVCRSAFELPGTDPSVQAPCPQCRRQLRVSSILATAEQ
jgi:WD40 repeat protein